MIKPDSIVCPARPGLAAAVPVLLSLQLLASCSTPLENPRLPRPVRVVKVEETATQPAAGFAGEITARRETAQAFRIAGKLTARWVAVGDRVRKGQVIARLDADDYRLASENVKAQLAAAKAEYAFSHADLERYRELLNQRVIAPPEFERRQSADTAARERVAALTAQSEQTANQVRYCELAAERDGVVTAFTVEAGDVVAAGQPVARLAQLDEKDVSFQVPERRIAELAPGQAIAVSLGSLGERRFRGSIREIAPAADPSTRTYRVKAALSEGREQALLGMTATVWLPTQARSAATLPRSAVFTRHDDPLHTKVWLVNADTVRAVPVTLGRPLDGERIEVAGVAPGQIVVGAGVHWLSEGQAVRILAAPGSQP